MTTNDTFGRDLSRWLHEEGEHRVPDHLTEVLVRTAATRQRPWWSSPERWLPMDSVVFGRSANLRPVAVLLLIAALLVAGLGVAYVANRAPVQNGGLAENGRIYVIAGQTVKSFAPDGSDPQDLVSIPGGGSGMSVSPDGTRVAYLQGPDPGVIHIQPLTGGTPTVVPKPEGLIGGDQISWSPASDRIAFPASANGQEFVYTAKVDGSEATRLGGDAIDPTTGIWWPTFSPDGQWIAFVGIPNGADKDPQPGDIYLIHPDGSGLHVVEHGVGTEGGGNLAWSPDPGVSKLLFVRNGVEIFDVATSKSTALGLGFWGSWSPDGRRIAAWTNGIVIVDPADAPFTADELVRPHPTFTGSCQDHPELAGKAVCSMVTWSPDGTRVIGTDIAGGGVLSLPADGKGAPVLLDGTAGAESYAWQPIRP